MTPSEFIRRARTLLGGHAHFQLSSNYSARPTTYDTICYIITWGFERPGDSPDRLGLASALDLDSLWEYLCDSVAREGMTDAEIDEAMSPPVAGGAS